MTFRRVPRSLVDPKKHEQIREDEVVLMWTDNPPSPCLSIYLGRQLAERIGLNTSVERVQLFIGSGSDEGRVGIKNAGARNGDYRCVPHGWGTYRVYLPAHVSVTHFQFCKRTMIPASDIEVRSQMLIFAFAGVTL